MDGPHTTYNQVYVAIDPDMGPLVDLGVSNFEADIDGGHSGSYPVIQCLCLQQLRTMALKTTRMGLNW